MAAKQASSQDRYSSRDRKQAANISAWSPHLNLFSLLPSQTGAQTRHKNIFFPQTITPVNI